MFLHKKEFTRGSVLLRYSGACCLVICLCLIVKISGLFEQLDGSDGAGTNALGIKNYGVSMTTLEEVFLKIGQHFVAV